MRFLRSPRRRGSSRTQYPIYPLGKRISDETCVLQSCFDNKWVARPARTNETPAGSQKPRCTDIVWRVANHKAVRHRKPMLACRALVE